MEAHQNQFDILTSIVNALISSEKKCVKLYAKLEKAAETPELGKALNPEQTSMNEHIGRLKLIKKLLPNNVASITPLLNIDHKVKLTKAKNNQQDQLIAHTALQLQAIKIVDYEFLLALSKEAQLSHAITILEQSINENNATTEWIKRTLQHLIHENINNSSN